jgi:hypothetical protein
MFMEYVNIFGLKLSMMEEWFRKNSVSADVGLAGSAFTFKQHLAVLNYYLKLGPEYLDSLERGKPDDTIYVNINAISEKIALISGKDGYEGLLKQFKVNSENFIQKLKTFRNNSTKNMPGYLMDQFMFFARHFGACEEKLKMMRVSD